MALPLIAASIITCRKAIIVVLKEIIKNAQPKLSIFVFDQRSRLSLRELRSATSTLESVLLSLLHTRVTSKKAGLLKKGLIGLISGEESTSNTVADSACLAGDTAAANVCYDVKLTLGLGNAEGLVNDELESLKTEIVIYVSAVDGDVTGTGIEANSCNRLLSSACAVEIRFSTCVHLHYPPY